MCDLFSFFVKPEHASSALVLCHSISYMIAVQIANGFPQNSQLRQISSVSSWIFAARIKKSPGSSAGGLPSLCLFGKKYTDFCSGAQSTFQLHTSLMELHHMLDNGKPQSGAADLFGTAFVHPVKPFKYPQLGILREIGRAACRERV